MDQWRLREEQANWATALGSQDPYRAAMEPFARSTKRFNLFQYVFVVGQVSSEQIKILLPEFAAAQGFPSQGHAARQRPPPGSPDQ
jgi:hypothetical protein